MPAISGPKKWSVLVVDDRTMPRIAAKAMLASSADFMFIGEATSGSEALQLVPRLGPDVVLMDVDMAGMDGAETTRRLLQQDPNLTVLAWTVSDASDDLLRMIESGCVGYVLKDVGPDELHRAIRAGLRREAPIPRRMVPEILQRAVHQAPTPIGRDVSLTERELETLRLIAKGFPSKRIAVELGISRASVDTHLRNMYRKLGANNRGEAVSRALRAGLLAMSDL